MSNLLYKKESYNIIGACLEVHKRLGFGFLEAVYQEALSIEFELSGIPFEREKLLKIIYRDHILQKEYLADFVCHSKIILELKPVQYLEDSHSSQLFNYLKATECQLGLLVNFGSKSLEYKRIINQTYFN